MAEKPNEIYTAREWRNLLGEALIDDDDNSYCFVVESI